MNVKLSKRSTYIVIALIGVLLIGAPLLYWAYDNGYINIGNVSKKNTEYSKSAVIEQIKSFEVEWSEEDKEYWANASTFSTEFVSTNALKTNPRFTTSKTLFTVNNETIYTDDINYFLYVNHKEEYLNASSIENGTLSNAIDKVIADSLALQAVSKENGLKLEKGIFNNENKDFTKRNQALDDAKKYVDENLLLYIEGEQVSLWFNNIVPPEVGVEEARKIADERIKDLHKKVKSGELSMKEAGDTLKKDHELKKIDVAYEPNAYHQFKMLKGDPPFFGEGLNEFIIGLDEGEVSDVFTVHDAAIDQDRYFTIIKVTKKNGSFASYDEWLNKLIKDAKLSL